MVATMTVVSTVTASAEGSAPAVKTHACRTNFADAPTLDQRLAQAAADVRVCESMGVIDPKPTRRILSAIEDLRDDAGYDRRRAHGNLSEQRERQFDRRLEFLMDQVASP